MMKEQQQQQTKVNIENIENKKKIKKRLKIPSFKKVIKYNVI